MIALIRTLALTSWLLSGPIVFAAPAPEAPKAPAARSDRHGDALPPNAFQRFGTVQYRNGAGILTIVYSPDGKRIASAGGTPWAAQGVTSGDHTIRIWDVASGKEVRQLRDHAVALSCLTFSPDGKHIAACTLNDQSIRIWEVDSDKEPRVIVTNQNGAATMTFAYAPDGKTLAVGQGPMQEVAIFDVDTGKAARAFGRHSVSIDSITFAKGGKQLATKTGPVVRLWDIEKGEIVRLFRPKNYHNKAKFLALETRTVPIFSTAPAVFSPDGKTLAFEGNDSTLYLFDVETGKEQRRLVHQGAVASASFSPDGKQIVTGSHDNTVRVWDAATGKELQHVEQHFGGYAVAVFSPAGKVFATAGGDHTIRFWDAETAKPLRARDGHQAEMFTAAVAADGKIVISVGRDNVVRFWDLSSGKLLRQFADDRDTFDRVAFSPDARRFASYSEDSEMTRVWDLAGGKLLREFRGKALGLAFGPDDLVVIGNPDNKLVAWSVASGERVKRYDHLLAEQGRFAFSADLKTLGVLAPGGALETCDALTGKKLRTAEVQANNEPIVSFALSPDGSRAALMMPGGVAALWDIPQNRLMSQLVKPGGPAFSNLTGSLCFSPDGRTLAITGAGNSAVVLWEVATGKERVAFEGHRGPLTFVAYAPDGKTVLSGSWDTTVLAWDIYGLREAARDVPNQELDDAWKELADGEASQGLRAMRKLLAGQRQTVPMFSRHLKPVVPVSKDEIARMIKDLDSDNFDVRQKGFDGLDRLGPLAQEALRKALAQELSLEARRKVEQLLEKLREGPTPAGMLREIRALEVLEVIGTPEARTLLEKMAGGAPNAPLTGAAKASLTRLPMRPAATR
jgi:WD40 repeat protein